MGEAAALIVATGAPRVNSRNLAILVLSWLGALCGVLIVALSEALPYRISLLRPEGLYSAFVEIQLAFLLLAWPLFLPGLLQERKAAHVLAALGALFVSSLPLALTCANVSGLGAGRLAIGQALAAGTAAFVAALFAVGLRHRPPWYFLGVFVVCVGLPPDMLTVASPFWGAERVREGSAIALQAAVFGGAALFLWAVAAARKRGRA